MKKQNICKFVCLAALAGALMTSRADATIIFNLNDATPVAVGKGNGNPTLLEIATALNITVAQLGSLLYKLEANGAEEGSLQASYNGVITQTGGGDNTVVGATINWNGPQVANAGYLLVKDGSKEPTIAWSLYLVGWDGMEQIQIGDVYNHAISHVAIYGGIAPVPEPTTIIAGLLLLLPLAASVVRFFRRKRTA